MELTGKPEGNAGRDADREEEGKKAGNTGAETVKAISGEELDKVSGGLVMPTPPQ